MNKTLINVLIGAVVGALILYAGILVAPKPVVPEPPVGSVTSPYDLGGETCSNGLCTMVVSADFKNGTTTIVSFANPYMGSATTSSGQQGRATSTIDLVQLQNTGVATTSYSIACGTTYVASAFPDAENTIIYTSQIATSTNFGTIKSGTNQKGWTYGGGGLLNASSSIAFGPSQYFVCKATNVETDITIHNTAFSNNTNTFAGKFWVRIIRGY